MRILDSYTTRYVWQHGGCLHSDATSVPSVRIEDETIPPLAKASAIICHSRCRDEMARSELWITWSIIGTKVGLQLLCRADDERLKEQYRATPNLAERVVDFLAAEACRAQSGSAPRIETEAELSDEEIPTTLQPFVFQAKVWEKFVREHQHALHSCSADVGSEGFLLLHINRGSLLIDEKTQQSDEGDSFPEISQYFLFNPVSRPPVVTEELVYWEFVGEKVLVVLAHERSDERYARHFNYAEAFQRWVEKKKAFELRIDKAREQNVAEDAQKLKRTIEESKSRVLASLLAP